MAAKSERERLVERLKGVKALEEELDVFYSAFIQKNELFPPPELSRDGADIEPVDPDVIMKMAAMMEGIDHRTRRKAIGDGAQ